MATTAADVMTTQLITMTPATPITEFARICTEDGVSGAPVVRVDGALVGIVSKTDLIQRMLETHPKFGASEDNPAWEDNVQQVSDIMSERVLTVSPGTPIAEIAERMASDRIHRVAVMDGEKLVGLVTSLDLLAHWPE